MKDLRLNEFEKDLKKLLNSFDNELEMMEIYTNRKILEGMAGIMPECDDKEFIRSVFLNLSNQAFHILAMASINNQEDYKIVMNCKKTKRKMNYLNLTFVKKNSACISGYLLKDNTFRLDCMEVLGEDRNLGVGTELMSRFLEKAKEYGIKAITLTAVNQFTAADDYTQTNDRLNKFYKKFGFKDIENSFREMYLILDENITLEEVKKYNNEYKEVIGITRDQEEKMMKFEKSLKEIY